MNGSVKLVRITSTDLSNSSYGTDTDIDWRSNDSDLHQIHKIHLKTIIFPNSSYNINEYTNTIKITSSDMITVLPIANGQYNLDSYLLALKEKLDLASFPNTFIITQDQITKKLIFKKSGGAQFKLNGKDSGNNQWRESGCKKDVDSIGLTAISSSMPDLSGLRHVYIESITSGKTLLTGNVAKYSVIADFSISVPFGSFQTLEFDEITLNQVTYRGFKQLSKMDIRLTDDFNRNLDLNGLDWIIILEAHSRGS